MSESPNRHLYRFSVKALLVVMTITAILVWQASIVRERKALLDRARKSGASIEYRGESTPIRALMGDRPVWSVNIPPDSEFYDQTIELRRAFPEAYINHLGPMIMLPAKPEDLIFDVPAPSPPIRSAWWGF